MDANKDFKILVVDDTPELLEIAIRTLKKANYTVVSAANGAECINVLSKEKPDLILLDVMLPDMNGKDLAKSIKNNPQFSSVFIILLSSLKTSSDNIAEGLEDGADGYIVRPVNKRELLARVASAFRIIKAERESMAAYIKYHSLFSSMQEGVYLHEMVYNETGKAIDYRIIEANPASENHLHIKVSDAVGKLASELFKTKEAPFLEIYAKVADDGKPISFEHYFQPMEKYFQISVFSPVRGKFATAFSDITIKKQAEEKIKLKNEELQKINAEKDKFFSIIAHDLKSPFNSIMGFSELLLEELENKNYESLEKYSRLILKSSENAMNLLTNLMEWSQSQTGRLKFTPADIDLVAIINEVTLLLNDSASQKSIAIKRNVTPKTYFFADKAMISTVIRNLISNAIKFTNINGIITVSVQRNKDKITVSIKDNGIGIPKEAIDKLFRIDSQYTTIGTQKEKGTGLGLILCREFVEKHEGKIWVESEEARGSTFFFTLPCNLDSKQKMNIHSASLIENEAKPITPEISGLKVLIAEDDETSEMLISIELKKFSNIILKVSTGKEAIETCRRNPDIDLVFMDIQMPGINGYEATRQIREFNKDVVIIAQTAYGLSGDRGKALEAGCNDYISKPVKKVELQKLIDRYFG